MAINNSFINQLLNGILRIRAVDIRNERCCGNAGDANVPSNAAAVMTLAKSFLFKFKPPYEIYVYFVSLSTILD